MTAAMRSPVHKPKVTFPLTYTEKAIAVTSDNAHQPSAPSATKAASQYPRDPGWLLYIEATTNSTTIGIGTVNRAVQNPLESLRIICLIESILEK